MGLRGRIGGALGVPLRCDTPVLSLSLRRGRAATHGIATEQHGLQRDIEDRATAEFVEKPSAVPLSIEDWARKALGVRLAAAGVQAPPPGVAALAAQVPPITPLLMLRGGDGRRQPVSRCARRPRAVERR